MSSICTVPPPGRRRVRAVATCSASCLDRSWMRLEAAALPPSTARKALVMATLILFGSKWVTLPLRRMTWTPSATCRRAGAAPMALSADRGPAAHGHHQAAGGLPGRQPRQPADVPLLGAGHPRRAAADRRRGRLRGEPADDAAQQRSARARTSPPVSSCTRRTASTVTVPPVRATWTKHIPAIAGQHYPYLMRQFDHIRTGQRRNSDPEMVEQIQGFTAEQQAAVLDYTARLRPPRTSSPPTAGPTRTSRTTCAMPWAYGRRNRRHPRFGQCPWPRRA
jgi:cytochrome c553